MTAHCVQPTLMLCISEIMLSRFVITFLCLLSLTAGAVGQGHAQSVILQDAEEAFRQARQLERPVLLVFSGSDWCIPCMKFAREVLADSAFQEFARKRLVVLKADFPQRTQLPADLVEQNDKLAEQYNPEGKFPHILLLDKDGHVLTQIDWYGKSVDALQSAMQVYLPEVAVATPREFYRKAVLMGCGFEFTIVESDSVRAEQLLDECEAEVSRIEHVLSEWIDTTETGRVNSAAGADTVVVSSELFGLLERALGISKLTQGAFDVSFAGLGDLWKFDGAEHALPDSARVRARLGAVGYRKIRLLDSLRVFLPEKGMRIGFGSIGKGYAADRVKQLLIGKGVTSGVINASGDLTAWGTRPNGTLRKVGIADPAHPSEVLLWLPVRDITVATSGNYEKFFTADDVRYAHIIDPRTGYPVRGVQSVTVISPSAELSDALATSVFVLGVEVGLNLIDQLPDTECIVVDAENRVHYSKDLKHL